MSAISIGIIGKEQQPLYLREFSWRKNVDGAHPPPTDAQLFGLQHDIQTNESISLQQQFIIHTAVDKFLRVAGPQGYGWRKEGEAGADAMFVGCLQHVHDMKVYAYSTTTRILFLLVVKDNANYDSTTLDETIKRLFVKIHRVYCEFLMNPFSDLHKKIESASVDRKLDDIIQAYNHTIVHS